MTVSAMAVSAMVVGEMIAGVDTAIARCRRGGVLGAMLIDRCSQLAMTMIDGARREIGTAFGGDENALQQHQRDQ